MKYLYIPSFTKLIRVTWTWCVRVYLYTDRKHRKGRNCQEMWNLWICIYSHIRQHVNLKVRSLHSFSMRHRCQGAPHLSRHGNVDARTTLARGLMFTGLNSKYICIYLWWQLTHWVIASLPYGGTLSSFRANEACQKASAAIMNCVQNARPVALYSINK